MNCAMKLLLTAALTLQAFSGFGAAGKEPDPFHFTWLVAHWTDYGTPEIMARLIT